MGKDVEKNAAVTFEPVSYPRQWRSPVCNMIEHLDHDAIVPVMVVMQRIEPFGLDGNRERVHFLEEALHFHLRLRLQAPAVRAHESV